MKKRKLLTLMGIMMLSFMMLLTACTNSSKKTSSSNGGNQKSEVTGNGNGSGNGSGSNSGKATLNFQGAFYVSISDNKSTELGKLEKGNSNKETIIKLVFDRGVAADNWDNNKGQIKLQSSNGDAIQCEVFRIEGSDGEKSNIFIKPLSELKTGESYKIVIGKDLKANNGNPLGKEETISFTYFKPAK